MKPAKLDEVIVKFKKIHGTKYDYSKISQYINGRTDLDIICKIHGVFKQNAQDHIKGYGCPQCGKKNSIDKQRKSIEEIKSEINNNFNGNITLISEEYINNKTPLEFHCNIHNESFRKTWGNIKKDLSKKINGCQKCNKDRNKYSNDEFIMLAMDKHNKGFVYPEEYVSSKIPIKILCPNHGHFNQMPYSHLAGHGCPKCYKNVSKSEIEISDFICSLGLSVRNSDKKILNGKQIDILIPEKLIGIEYNGLVWHSENFGKKDKNYHLNKSIAAGNSGIKLIHIFENEWHLKNNIVKNKLINILGKFSGKSIGARQCEIQNISYNICFDFLNKYHIQGADTSPIRYGAYYCGELVGVMTFKKINNDWHLNRFATSFNYKISGLTSKIIKMFIKSYNPAKIITFADRRWTPNHNDNMYSKIGFDFVCATEPSYAYFKLRSSDIPQLLNRQKYMKHKILKMHPEMDSTLTEWDMMRILGYDRVYDCGHWKYQLINNSIL